MFTKRQISLIQTIMNQSEGISGKRLSTHLNVSDRTIRNDINQINQILKAYDCTISSTNTKGYYITSSNKVLLQELLDDEDTSQMDKQDRFYATLGYVLFSSKCLTIEDLADALFVSEQTIYKDMVRMQKVLLLEYSIDLFEIKGNLILCRSYEEAIRMMFFKLSKKEILTANVDNPLPLKLICHTVYQENDFYTIKKLIENFYRSIDVQLSSDSLYMLTWAIYFCILRNKQGFCMDACTPCDNVDDEVCNVVDALCNKHYLLYPQDQYLLQKYMKTLGMIKSNQSILIISDDCKKIMNEFSDEVLRKYDLDICSNQELYDNMQLHVDVMLHRLQEQLPIINPMMKEVKQKYPFAYEIAMLIVPIVFKYRNEYLNDDEISYVAIYIQYVVESQDMKLKTLLVSGSGAGITRLMKQWVIKNFADTLEVLDCIPSYEIQSYLSAHEVEFIISSVPIQTGNYMISYIHSIPGKLDAENIQACMKQLRIEKRMYHVINKIFHKRLFKKFSQRMDFETVIADLSILLYKEHKIVDYRVFTQDVIAREKVYPTVVNPYFMIPHPLQEGAIEDAVAIGLLEDGLQDQPNMRCILLLALNSEKKQDLDVLFHIINVFAMDATLISDFVQSDHHHVISNLIKISGKEIK